MRANLFAGPPLSGIAPARSTQGGRTAKEEKLIKTSGRRKRIRMRRGRRRRRREGKLRSATNVIARGEEDAVAGNDWQ